MARSSQAIIAHSVTAAASTALASATASVQKYDAMVITADLIGVGGVTLDLWLEESWDAGVTWYEVGHFAQLAAGAAAVSVRIALLLEGTLRTVLSDPVAPAAAGVLAASTFVSGPWGPSMRVVSRTGAGSPSGGTVVQTIRFLQWQQVDGR